MLTMTNFNVKICKLLFDRRDHNIFNITFCILESYRNSSQRDRINVIFFTSIPSPQILLYLSLIIYTSLFQSISIHSLSYGFCPSPLLLTDFFHPPSFLRILSIHSLSYGFFSIPPPSYGFFPSTLLLTDSVYLLSFLRILSIPSPSYGFCPSPLLLTDSVFLTNVGDERFL